MKEAATFHLEIERFIKAPIEKVFDAFTQEAVLRQWHCPRGLTVVEARADARVGGDYRIVMAARDGSRYAVGGVFQAIERPNYLAYTWCGDNGSAAEATTLIEVRLSAGEGGTKLQMRHTGFPTTSSRDSHRSGWQSVFNRLSDLVDPEGSAGTVTLFGDPRSSYCWTARLGLAEKGVKYKLVAQAPRTPEQLAVHPFGRIPALRDGETEIYEARAILGYVDEAFDGPSLISNAGPTARARGEQWISVINSYCYDAMARRYVLQYAFAEGSGREPDRAVIAAALPEIDMQLGLFEEAYGPNDYLTGGGMAMADLFLAPLIFNIGRFPEGARLLEKYPRVRNGQMVMRSRPSFAATAAKTG
jgi:glutathione S-transferase